MAFASCAPRGALVRLPTELLDSICLLLGETSWGVAPLCRLRAASRWTHRLALSPTAFAAPAAARPAAEGVARWWQLAVHNALAAAGGHDVHFQVASVRLTADSAARLRVLGEFMRDHPRLGLRIEAHAGSGGAVACTDRACERAEVQVSCQRACAVADCLVALGAREEQIQATGWGTSLTQTAAFPAGVEAVRADLFFVFVGEEQPEMPSYYKQSVPPPQVARVPHQSEYGAAERLQETCGVAPPRSCCMHAKADAARDAWRGN